MGARIAGLKSTARRLAGSLVRRPGIVCLNYHRIGDGRGSVFDRGLWSATEEGFDAQLRWLGANFDVITPPDIPDVVRSGRGRHAMVTFDDGYGDNFRAAYPILRARGLKATFFVATGFIDAPRLPWWDELAWMVRTSERAGVELPAYLPAPVVFDEPERERAIRTLLRTYKQLPSGRTGGLLDAVADATGTGRYREAGDAGQWMTWDMLRELVAGGMSVGGHTVNHPILARMPREEQAREIAGCARRLREELGVPMRTFSYPVGKLDSFNEDTRACLREAGVTSAFTYYGGYRRLGAWDDLDVPRSAIEQDMSFDAFRAEVLAPWLTRG